MNISQGPHYIDDTLTFTVTTHRFDTGANTDADAVPAYRIYEDETGTAILTGNMAKLDDANTTGFYSEQITLSAANGFEAGKSYSIIATAAVNSVSGATSGSFRMSGVHPANVTQIEGSDPTNQIRDSVVDDATRIDASALNTASARVDLALPNAAPVSSAIGDVTKINGTSIAGTGTRVADAFVTMFNVAAPVFTTASVNQTGDNFARIGANGSGLTSLAPSSTALSTATWTGTLATNLGTLAGHDPGSTLASATAVGTVSTNVTALQGDVTTLLGRITSTLFSGITSLANWLGALAGKTADSSTQTEIRATTAGAGYTITTDSLEAIRDRGDAAWITATGFSTHSAADVWAVATRTITGGTITTYTGNTPQTGDAYAYLGTNVGLLGANLTAADDAVMARLGAPAGASMSADIAAVKSDSAAILDDTGTSGVLLVSSYNLYSADIQYSVDEANAQDELTVRFFKNGVRQTSGITSVQIQVTKRADGTDLIAATNMTQIGTTGSYRYDATGAERLTAGEAAEAVVTWTQDAGTRLFSRLIGRDSIA